MTKERLCSEADISEGEVKKCAAGEAVLALARIAGAFYCVDDTCTHGEFSLSEGEVDVEECTLECPKHGSLFDLKTGEAITLPATRPVRVYEVLLEAGEVYVEI